jgi:S-adenosylmethionine:tRNA-ribosyltransferase-isomerase (queuine synthetase)
MAEVSTITRENDSNLKSVNILLAAGNTIKTGAYKKAIKDKYRLFSYSGALLII